MGEKERVGGVVGEGRKREEREKRKERKKKEEKKKKIISHIIGI